MDIVYVDILTRENCHQFRLLIWNSLIDQFVHPVGMGLLKWMGGIVSLASCEYHFLQVHKNLVQHPSNYISIIVTYMLWGHKKTYNIILFYEKYWEVCMWV